MENTPEDEKQLEQYSVDLKVAQKKYRAHELDLYAEKCLLSPYLRDFWDHVRQNPTWYLREELVRDCIGRSGCCSRNCKCCQSRHLTAHRQKGLGHCTIDCWCCVNDQGFQYSAEERDKIEKQFQDTLENNNPNYLLGMIRAHFCRLPPSPVEAVASQPKENASAKTKISAWAWIAKRDRR